MTDTKFLERMYALTDDAKPYQVAGIYDSWASSYEQEIVDGLGYAMPHRVAALLPKLIGDRSCKLLDAGCGTGLSGSALRDAGYNNIDGCDISNGMLEKARGLAIYNKLFCADISTPPISVDDQSYDVVTVVGAFAYGHLGAVDIAELLRITSHGGVLIITTNDHYYEEGSLDTAIVEMDRNDELILLAKEHGDHMPGKQLGGWVYALGKNRS